MRPNFALALSSEGVALLRHRGSAWAQIAHVAFDGSDPGEAVRGLAEQAAALAPDGRNVSLILPDDQIKYIALPDPGPPRTRRDAAVKLALDGATPYQIDELTFDWTKLGDALQVAAVARETLEEAEAFVAAQGFVPVDFVAQTMPEVFSGPVNFGPAGSWPGSEPDRLVDPIRIIPANAAALAPDPVAPPAAPMAAVSPEPAPEPAPSRQDRPVSAAPVMAATVDTEAGDATQLRPAPMPGPQPDAAGGADSNTPKARLEALLAAAQNSAAPAPEPDGDTLPSASKSISFSALRAARAESQSSESAFAAPAGGREGKAPLSIGSSSEAPGFQPMSGNGPAAPGFAAPRRVRAFSGTPDDDGSAGVTAPAEDRPAFGEAAQARARDLLSLGGTAAQGLAARTRRGAMAALDRINTQRPRGEEDGDLAPRQYPEDPSLAPGDTEPTNDAGSAPALLRALRNRLPRRGGTAQNPQETDNQTAPKNFETVLRELEDDSPAIAEPLPGKATLRPLGGLTPDEELERMTLFGQRRRPPDRPKIPTSLIASILLLIGLAGIAGWASVYFDDRIARWFGGDAPNAVAALTDPAAVAPAASGEQTAASDPDEAAGDSVVASLGNNAGVSDAAPQQPDSVSQPQNQRALSADEAAATYAATGIWQRSPTPPNEPAPALLGDVYIASIDPDVLPSDAVALPRAQTLLQETPLPAPSFPPPPGVVFDLDERGLVRATPEGALSPDGHRVFAGTPPVVPPLRDPPPATTAPDGSGALTTPLDLERLQGIRPEARPPDLIEASQRVQLGGFTVAELSQRRPVLRPVTEQEVAAAADPTAAATDQAVQASLVPLGRPRNIDAIVARATQTQEETESSPVQLASAAVAPRNVSPSLPTSASVAREATVANAIPLNKVSLIGVYGTQSSRRALVRLPNGKYEKVEVGDRIDGGRVAAIGQAELRYVKRGRNITLEMPSG